MEFGLEESEGNEKKGISRLVIEGHRREKVYLIQSKVIAHKFRSHGVEKEIKRRNE